MGGCGWTWVVGVKLWLVMRGGSKIMAGHRWWQQNYGWLWVFLDGHEWSWMVAQFNNVQIYQLIWKNIFSSGKSEF